MIIKLNNEICKDKDHVLDLIENGNVNGGFTLSVTLDNGDEYKIDYYNETEYWYKNGKYHREDGPAIKYKDGAESWYSNGVCTQQRPHQKAVVSPIEYIELDIELSEAEVKSSNRKLKAVWSYEAEQDLKAYLSNIDTAKLMQYVFKDYF